MDRSNRTWLCTVLFMDIVGYSKLPVEQQVMVKQSFSTTVSESLKGLADEDCIKLDTGDGLAVCYLGDPEDVLIVAVGLRNNFKDVSSICTTCFSVRMGINLGPVKIFEDINGQRNIIGDGINVAQRIMNFSQPNQLLVSRSYYEVVSCLSENIQKMFSYTGTHNDKHVREHAVYEVVSDANHEELVSSQAGATPENNDTPEMARAASTDLDERILKAVRKELALIMGPVAEILIRQAARKSTCIDDLYSLLANEIPGESEREQFLENRRRKH